METWFWLPLGAVGLSLAWVLAPRLMVAPEEDDRDQPSEGVAPDAVGLGLRDAHEYGGFLGAAPPDFAPPDAGDELEEE